MIDTVRRSASPHDAVLGWVERLGRYADVSLHRSARVTPGIIVYRLDDRLFFANVRYFKGRVREAIRAAPTPVAWLVFDAEAVTHVDSTGLDALDQLVQELRASGDHARRRPTQDTPGGAVRDGRRHRDDRTRTLLPDGTRRRTGNRQFREGSGVSRGCRAE